MTILEAIKTRHSVRSYTDKTINKEIIHELNKEIQNCNSESKLHIQLITNDKKAFTGLKAKFGKFKGVKNYIAFIGEKNNIIDEQVGYFGERIVMKAQQLGLNTCWVAVTYNKNKISISDNESLVCVIALGYGVTQGTSHKTKEMDQLCSVGEVMPDWFQNGMKAAMLAPTAMNKQNFLITLHGNDVKIETKGKGFANIDLGIIKYHFEVGAQSHMFQWIK